MSTKLKLLLGSIVGAFVLQVAAVAWAPASGAVSWDGLLLHAVLPGGPREASAAPPLSGPRLGRSLDVAVERCSQAPTGGLEYAQHAYPGLTAPQLSQVRTLGHVAQTGVTNAVVGLPGYPFVVADGFVRETATVYVRDGMVAVLCGTPGAHWFDTVTFTLLE
jgi:hypothetical protein